jgi:phospholipid/cholesterol/gamma-HCH transport system substrate-binding protein
MGSRIVETLTGLFVVLIAAWSLVVFMQKTENVSVSDYGYNLIAKFNNVEGIEIGSPVMLGGVKIGIVTNKTLDPLTYLVILHLNIKNAFKLPDDSEVSVSSSGLLGDKFVSITPGGSEKFIEDKGEIMFTQSSVSLENMIGKMIFMKENGK